VDKLTAGIRSSFRKQSLVGVYI